ncbi:MAG: FAD-dependent oxidoreductase [Deltaproteobacteria bacterium]|nr:FAD-dependent oxidoreductase [Deltaproteobacteria bacterium]
MSEAVNLGGFQPDVVIVGGGLSGLTAGLGLVQNGLKPLILERDAILGGRARSWIDPVTGDSVTVGPHIFLSEYPNMRKFLGMLGTDDRIVWQKGRFIDIVDGEKITEIRMRPLPPPTHYVPAIIENPKFFPFKDIRSNRLTALMCMGLSEEDVLTLDRMDALTVLRRLGVTEDYIKNFWAFTGLAIMNVPLSECSAGSIMRFFKLMISHKQYDVGFGDSGLGDMFTEQAKALIEKGGGRVLTGVEVSRITGEGDRATGVRLKDGTEIVAGHVLAALPPTQLGAIVPEAWKRFKKPFSTAHKFAPSPYISTYLWFDRKLTSRQFWARKYDENDLNCDFYDYSNIYRNRKTDTSLITTNCIYCARFSHMTDAQVVERTVRELSDFLPEAASAKLVHSLVVRIPMAIHCPGVGVESLRPAVDTDVLNLKVAGDWIQTNVPASMESACGSGWLAAQAILAEMGRDASYYVKRSPSQGIAAIVEHLTPRLRPIGLVPDPKDYVV